ncbi:MAG: DNA replication/repair protein RecF [Bacteroidales bacterium]|jgi:DNA replication and repair protein RecF|nr:DNA replication/repair protein RecF [Bacteroidales bacterium]MDD4213964.1 DNA replication/repair protein RecF [Bacteroidales bacterium]
MYLKKLSLKNFKNYQETELFFSEKINCFVGNNGVGKTNLLDAIHYLSFCKSYFNVIDTQNIRHGQEFFTIQGSWVKQNTQPETVLVTQKRSHQKVVKLNKKEYSRLADHIGLFPVVIVSPHDSDMIYSGSDERRRFLDSFISQFDRIYLDDLINYNKALFQRNKLLKLFFESRSFDADALEIWDTQLVTLGTKIHSKRDNFIRDFEPYFNRYYKLISGDKEKVKLKYESQLNDAPLTELLAASLSKDRSVLYTTAGIHKDDLNFIIGGHPLRKFGSQGQQKSYTIAIKLAQFDYIKNAKGYKPVLLFDDIFDKLDDERVEHIVQLTSENNFGQVFITDTQKERIVYTIKKINSPGKVFIIAGNNANEIEL